MPPRARGKKRRRHDGDRFVRDLSAIRNQSGRDLPLRARKARPSLDDLAAFVRGPVKDVAHRFGRHADQEVFQLVARASGRNDDARPRR